MLIYWWHVLSITVSSSGQAVSKLTVCQPCNLKIYASWKYLLFILYNRYELCYQSVTRFGGVMVSVLGIGPKVLGFKLG
jgi:hypothetical protein